MPVINRTPYRNLIITGTVGVGKTGVGRRLVAQMDGANFLDLEIELSSRQNMTPEKIRETFGLARLRSLENTLVEEITLRRSTIVSVSGLTLLDPLNLDRLRETGPVICLTAALGEILRRTHSTEGGRFHQRDFRAVLLGRLKREREITHLGLSSLDTTRLSLEEVTQYVKTFWLQEADV